MPTDPSLIPDQYEHDEFAAAADDDPIFSGTSVLRAPRVSGGAVTLPAREEDDAGTLPARAERGPVRMSGLPPRGVTQGNQSDVLLPTTPKEDKSRAGQIAAITISAAIAGAGIGAAVAPKRRGVLGAAVGAVVVGTLAGGATAIWVA